MQLVRWRSRTRVGPSHPSHSGLADGRYGLSLSWGSPGCVHKASVCGTHPEWKLAAATCFLFTDKNRIRNYENESVKYTVPIKSLPFGSFHLLFHISNTRSFIFLIHLYHIVEIYFHFDMNEKKCIDIINMYILHFSYELMIHTPVCQAKHSQKS